MEQNLASIGFQYIILGMVIAGIFGVLLMYSLTRRGRQLPSWMVWFALLGSWFLIEVGFSNFAAVYQYSQRYVLGGAFPSNYSQFWVRFPALLFRNMLFGVWPARLAFGIVVAIISMAIFAYFARQLDDAETMALPFAVVNCIWVAVMLVVFYGISVLEISDRELALKFYLSVVGYGVLLAAQWRIGSSHLSTPDTEFDQ